MYNVHTTYIYTFTLNDASITGWANSQHSIACYSKSLSLDNVLEIWWLPSFIFKYYAHIYCDSVTNNQQQHQRATHITHNEIHMLK